MSDRDYYEILGLTPKADGAMVDQAYWHLARKYQGLAATNARAQYMLDELNEAYGVLGNPRLRAQYDAFRDDVLLRHGMIQPVRAMPNKRDQAKHRKEKAPRSAPSIQIQYGPMYALSVIVCALAFAGAWQGVSLLLVAPALVGGLAISVAPIARSRVAAAHLRMPAMPSMSMPAMPSVTVPSIQAPKLAMPSLSDTPLGGQKDDGVIDADELRVSTAATIARWRKSVGLKQLEPRLIAQDSPDTTLVDIVSDEREIEESGEPLNAVMDILRGSRREIGSR